MKPSTRSMLDSYNPDGRSFINPYNAVVQQPLLILPPRRWIFKRYRRVLALLLFSALFSVNVFVYLSIPVYMMAFWFLYELSAVWRAHRYSVLVLWGLTLAFLLLFLTAGGILRTWLWQALSTWLF